MGFVNKRSSLRTSLADANNHLPMVFLTIITMAAIAIFIQYDRMKSPSERDIRAKAYQQTATGIRLDVGDMTLSGGATKDPTGTYIQF
jgi:hypothetical protein